jgi:hypothetical protein
LNSVLGHLDENNCGQSFSCIVADDRIFIIFKRADLLSVIIDCPCQCHAKTSQMRAAVDRVDDVDV